MFPKNLIMSCLYNINIATKLHSTMVFDKKIAPTFVLKAIDICHRSLLSNYKPPTNSNNNARLHTIFF